MPDSATLSDFWIPDFWTDDTSVFLYGFMTWKPETWGTIGWTREGDRTKALNALTDPFVALAYATGANPDPEQQRKVLGYMLVSHECGERNTFTHEQYHNEVPEKWNYAVRVLRAFRYPPELRLDGTTVCPELSTSGIHITAYGAEIEDPEVIAQLRTRPAKEVSVFAPKREPILSAPARRRGG